MAVMQTEPASLLLDCPTDGRGEFHTLKFRAFGTVCRVDFQLEPWAAASEFKSLILAWSASFEEKFSRFKPDSLISRINRAAGREPVPLDDEAESLFTLIDWFHWSSQGILDPTVLPLLELWDYRGDAPQVPSDEAVQSALQFVGWKRVEHRNRRLYLPAPGMRIDVGGIAKEYAVDRVVSMGLAAGITRLMVDFGHDLRVAGEAPQGGPWRIGLEDPHDPGRCHAGLAVLNRAVATSGDYLRGFTAGNRRHGHILDPRTGYPVSNGCRSVTALAPTCTEAGVLSTTAFVLGADEGMDLIDERYQVEGCIVTERNIHYSSRFHEYAIE
jgi:thiamine biosynthesis lipoprotein